MLVTPALAQRLVYDPDRAAALLQEYILQSHITGQQQAGEDINKQKKENYNITQLQIGAPTSVNVERVNDGPDLPEKAFLRTETGSSVELRNYLKWARQRRIATAALSVRLADLMQRQGGQPIDWSAHTALAGELSALSNEQLALSTLEANAVAEGRSRQKTKVAEHYKMELDLQRRADLEQSLAEHTES